LSILALIDIKRASPSVSWHGNVEMAFWKLRRIRIFLASAGVSGPILLRGYANASIELASETCKIYPNMKI
jgi:hypothetical protein